jgi:oxygen-independent coproporphyrinogen-3 oxidase
VETRFGIDFAATFAVELAELEAGPVQDGFVNITQSAIEVTEQGQLFVRNVCMPFDRYLREKTRDKPTFSRTV